MNRKIKYVIPKIKYTPKNFKQHIGLQTARKQQNHRTNAQYTTWLKRQKTKEDNRQSVPEG